MLVPLFDYVVLERVKGDSETKGGILLPEQEKNKSVRGLVIAIGPGELREDENGFLPICPLEHPLKNGIEVGDTVIFAHYAGSEVTDDGKDYTILRAVDIRAIVKKGEDK